MKSVYRRGWLIGRNMVQVYSPSPASVITNEVNHSLGVDTSKIEIAKPSAVSPPFKQAISIFTFAHIHSKREMKVARINLSGNIDECCAVPSPQTARDNRPRADDRSRRVIVTECVCHWHH